MITYLSCILMLVLGSCNNPNAKRAAPIIQENEPDSSVVVKNLNELDEEALSDEPSWTKADTLSALQVLKFVENGDSTRNNTRQLQVIIGPGTLDNWDQYVWSFDNHLTLVYAYHDNDYTSWEYYFQNHILRVAVQEENGIVFKNQNDSVLCIYKSEDSFSFVHDPLNEFDAQQLSMRKELERTLQLLSEFWLESANKDTLTANEDNDYNLKIDEYKAITVDSTLLHNLDIIRAVNVN